MLILFLAPGGGSVASSLATKAGTNAPALVGGAASAGVSSFAAGIIGGLIAPIFDLLFPAPTAVATIDGLPPELLLEQEEDTSVPQILTKYGTTDQTVIGAPPFTGGQCVGVGYNSYYNFAICSGGVFQGWSVAETTSGQWFGAANSIIKLIHPTLGDVSPEFADCSSGAVLFTTNVNGNIISISGALQGARFIDVRRSDGMPDNCGDPPGTPTTVPLPNVDIDPAVIPPPIEFPPPPLPGEEPSEEPKAPILPMGKSPLVTVGNPVEVATQPTLPNIGIKPPSEIEFVPPPVPVIPIPIPVNPEPTIPAPFVFPPSVPATEPLEPPGETATLDPLPEPELEEEPRIFPKPTFPGQLTPEGQIIIQLSQKIMINQTLQEECCEELLECFDEIKEILAEIEFQVNPPPPGDPSLQLLTSPTGEQLIVNQAAEIIWIRPVYTVLPNLNKQISASNPAQTVMIGSFIDYVVGGKFTFANLIAHSDNFLQAPKRCTGFGLFFKHGAMGFADYYIRVPPP